jgi:hypothetical protein
VNAEINQAISHLTKRGILGGATIAALLQQNQPR